MLPVSKWPVAENSSPACSGSAPKAGWQRLGCCVTAGGQGGEAGPGHLSLGPSPVRSALGSGVRAPNRGGKGQHCPLDRTAVSALAIVGVAGPATTSLLLFIVCLMSTSDDPLCRPKPVFVVSPQLSFLLSPRTRQDGCPLPTGALSARTNALPTGC